MINFLLRFKHRLAILFLVMGPGLITAFADNDAGGVATYSVAASKFGYAMLTTLIPITAVLMITQEIGARIAIVTGKGLGDLIREKFGIRIAILIFALLFTVNIGVIMQNLGGLKSALTLFQFDYRIFLPILILFLFFFITASSFKMIERFFLFLIFFYITYIISAFLAKPDWGKAFTSLVIPQRQISFDYLYTSIAVLGTTITAWGQFFINSYVKDKKITPDKLKYERLEIYTGAMLTDLLSMFMIVAVTATIFVNGIAITSAADAAIAIKPFAGDLAGLLFGIGLLVAGFLGCAIVPLATAYAFSEFFGFEGSLDTDLKRSRLFYGFFLFQILLGAILIMLPNMNLFEITLYADFLNGIMLPLIFYFLYKLANDDELMGQYKNNKTKNIFLVSSGIIITIAAAVGAVGKLFNL
jgi:NRAMP (natural resistance-associated macrophage protein)-like metal ion transporter